MKASVAGIIDSGGGIRIVVSDIPGFARHLQPKEVLFIVPNLLVDDPLESNQRNSIISQTIEYVESRIKEIS
jgi:hypothetical protein